MKTTFLSGMPVKWPEWFPRDELEGKSREGVPTYVGSVRVGCFYCSGEFWLGPRQQKLLHESEDSVVLICLACAAMSEGPNIKTRNLGNTDTLESMN